MNLNRDNRSLRNRGTHQIPNSSEYNDSILGRSLAKPNYSPRRRNRFEEIVIATASTIRRGRIINFDLEIFITLVYTRERVSVSRVQALERTVLTFFFFFFSHRTFVKSFNSRLSSRRALPITRRGTNWYKQTSPESSREFDK